MLREHETYDSAVAEERGAHELLAPWVGPGHDDGLGSHCQDLAHRVVSAHRDDDVGRCHPRGETVDERLDGYSARSRGRRKSLLFAGVQERSGDEQAGPGRAQELECFEEAPGDVTGVLASTDSAQSRSARAGLLAGRIVEPGDVVVGEGHALRHGRRDGVLLNRVVQAAAPVNEDAVVELRDGFGMPLSLPLLANRKRIVEDVSQAQSDPGLWTSPAQSA